VRRNDVFGDGACRLRDRATVFPDSAAGRHHSGARLLEHVEPHVSKDVRPYTSTQYYYRLITSASVAGRSISISVSVCLYVRSHI